MSARTCDECGKPLVTQRRGARFCDSDCKNAWHNKQPPASDATPKRLEAARGAEKPLSRPSRDGRGAKVYLTRRDIQDLLHYLDPHSYFWAPEAETRLLAKFREAQRRIRRDGR